MLFSYERHVRPFHQTEYIHDEDKGYIVWRRGSGGNMEILHLRTYEHRCGYGTELLRRMLKDMIDNEATPYATMFVFCREGNNAARAFYTKVGFDVSHVQGLYDEGSAVIFTARFDYLCKLHIPGYPNSISKDNK